MKNAPNDTNFPIAQRVEIAEFTSPWQKKLQECVTEIDELFSLLELPPHLKEGATAASRLFPLKVPRRYLDLIEKANPADPLLRQILPLDAETHTQPDYTADPLQELDKMHSPGVIQKYQGRVLLTLTGACAVNCRYCFRRAFPYNDANPTNKHWEATLSQLALDNTINEVILSGGDPLLLSDVRLQRIIHDLEQLDHLTTLRIHSRVPIFLPERITPPLLTLLQECRLKVVLVVHCNHARELDEDVAHALSKLKRSGVILLNQSVLLRGVNDQSATLIELSRRLFACDVLPYYLHLLDKVMGASHFDVEESSASQLHQAMLDSLPGYLVPKLVREIPGKNSKTPVML